MGDQTVQAHMDEPPSDGSLHVAAQRSPSDLILRVVNAGSDEVHTIFKLSSAQIVGLANLQTLQADDLKAVNIPSDLSKVAPAASSAFWKSGSELEVTLPKYSF